MSHTKKESLRRHCELLEVIAKQTELSALVYRALNSRIDNLAAAVSVLIQLTNQKWSDHHEELTELQKIMDEMKKPELFRKQDSFFQHHYEQFTGMLANYRDRIEAMPDDE